MKIIETDIPDLKIIEPRVFSDDRGYFLEVARLGQGLVADFPANSTQISTALNYPGIIKAFHFNLTTDKQRPLLELSNEEAKLFKIKEKELNKEPEKREIDDVADAEADVPVAKSE